MAEVDPGTPRSDKKEAPVPPPPQVQVEQVADSIYCLGGGSNAGMLVTPEGVLMVDTTGAGTAAEAYRQARQITDKRVRFVVLTHGHPDHGGACTRVFLEEGTEVIGHENVLSRYARYRELAGWNTRINAWIFGGRVLPAELRIGPEYQDVVYPTITYRDEYTLDLGGQIVQLFHSRGETDDGTIVWIPEKRVVFAGDLVQGGFPNLGNPMKVIRYEKEWHEGLARILALNPAVLVPGHGTVLRGPAAIKAALEPTIELLRFLHDQIVAHLNRGSTLEQMIEQIQLPPHLKDNPQLRTFHGHREFAIRGIYRRYAGWLDDMNVTSLFPAPRREVAQVLAEMCGGNDKILAKAKELLEEGRYQLGLHVVDLVIHNDPTNKDAHLLKAQLLEKIPETNKTLPTFMGRNVYLGAAAYERKLGGG